MRLIIAILVATASPVMAEPDPIHVLIPALEKSADAKTTLASVLPASIGAVTATTRGFEVTFSPRDTRPALARWGWTGVYAVSGDVHQRQFHIRKSTGAIGKDRIATEEPHAGRWSVRVTLTQRLDGPLPGLAAGASPAYELPRYPSRFDRIAIELREPADVEAALKNLKAPMMADIERELGPPDADVGSGLHVYTYKLGSTIHVGSPDGKRVMYIRVGDRDLYRK
jgi:hypothetical protein